MDINAKSEEGRFAMERPDHRFTETFRPRRRADVKSRLVEGEMVILDRAQGLVHQLNRTASYIWERCNGQCTPCEIAAQLCQNFEVNQQDAIRDVVAVIEELQKLRLIERSEERRVGKE